MGWVLGWGGWWCFCVDDAARFNKHIINIIISNNHGDDDDDHSCLADTAVCFNSNNEIKSNSSPET